MVAFSILDRLTVRNCSVLVLPGLRFSLLPLLRACAVFALSCAPGCSTDQAPSNKLLFAAFFCCRTSLYILMDTDAKFIMILDSLVTWSSCLPSGGKVEHLLAFWLEVPTPQAALSGAIVRRWKHRRCALMVSAFTFPDLYSPSLSFSFANPQHLSLNLSTSSPI